VNQFSDFSFTVDPEATASIHDNGVVILNLRSGRLYTTNGTGARIWRGVEQQLPLQTITEEISQEYQIAHSTARDHVVSFLSELERHTLVQREAAL